ncbi:MAG: sugar transferase [Actinomycetia bacterium]|nr:sugar transferase [Actinomycetes bacterium]
MRRTHYRRGKRLIDLTAAGLGLVLLAPVLVLLAGAVRWTMGSPVLFRQARPGVDGRLFDLIKFRTMTEGPGDDGVRLTPFGSWLRATSLDELPELWNVVRGEMSLVGPRPLLTEYLPLYDTRQARRHEVRPGITGLAQVSGRNALDWPERLELDVSYVERLSARLDIEILWMTVRSVIRREGINEDGVATMTRFGS